MTSVCDKQRNFSIKDVPYSQHEIVIFTSISLEHLGSNRQIERNQLSTSNKSISISSSMHILSHYIFKVIVKFS